MNINFGVLARPPSALDNRMTGTRILTPNSNQITKPGTRSSSEPRKQVPTTVPTTR